MKVTNENHYYEDELASSFEAHSDKIGKYFFIMLYGIAWSRKFDFGMAVAVILSRVFNIYLDDVNPNPTGWKWVSNDL